MPIAPQILTFGPFRIDFANASLWQGQERLPLKPKSFAVLQTLLERPQDLVTKEELLAAHWGDVAVGEAVLKTCIGEIRQTLGETASSPVLIETMHRRGYRFVEKPIPASQATVPLPTRPLVGREHELATLLEWWEATKQGERHVIFVTGEPGIGKTSLVDAFLEQLTAAGEGWIGRGHCIEQYGAGEAYLPFLEALGRLCRQPKGDALVSCLRQFAPTWLLHLPGLLEPGEIQGLLSSVIGATSVRMMRELADALEVFTKTNTLILSVEDLHWLDASSLELLTYLARRSHSMRLLVLGTYRPADLIVLKHPLKQAKQELLLHNRCQELSLECLPKAAVEEFLRCRLADHHADAPSLHAVAQMIYQRTEGNPLFMVNLVEYFVQHNLLTLEDHEWTMTEQADHVRIPTGLRQFIDVRVGQLDPDDRHLLAIASIAGMEFSVATIEAALGQTMSAIDHRYDDLVRREQFIQPQGTHQWPDGTVSTQYAFQHALYQEALYESVPLTQRVEWHRRIGEQLEQSYGKHTRDIAAELALHFERGQDADRASAYHQQAGEEAFKRSAHHEAILHLTKSLQLLNTLTPGPIRDQRELALQILLGIQIIQTKGFATSEAGQALGRAHELCQQFPKNENLIPSLYGLFRYYVTISDKQKAQDIRKQLDVLAKQTGEAEVLLVSLCCQGSMDMFWGTPQRALAPLQQAIALEKGIDPVSLLVKYGEETRIICRHFLSCVFWILGFPDQSAAQAGEALSLAHALNNPFVLTFSLSWKTVTHMMQRDYPQALSVGHEAVVLAQQHGYQQWETESQFLRASIHQIQGKSPEGVLNQEQRTALDQWIDSHPLLPSTIAFMSEAMLHDGQYQEGLTMAQNALDGIGDHGMTWYEAEWVRLKGELILGSGEPNTKHAAQEAEACFQEAIMIAKKQGAKSLELRAVMSQSRLWQQQGKGKQARPKLKTVYDWFTEGFDTKDLQDAKALLNSLT